MIISLLFKAFRNYSSLDHLRFVYAIQDMIVFLVITAAHTKLPVTYRKIRK